jgi:predicted glycoside hydrolase/deacetylase ChbG (UPF0249 family)
MCHPGEADKETAMISSYNMARQRELGILLDPNLKEKLVDKDIELISFAGL